MSDQDEAARVALLSEQRLFPATRLLSPAEAVGAGKVLLVRTTADRFPAQASVDLARIGTERDWADYADRRTAVEAGFGVGEAAARAMVADLRERTGRLGLSLYLARDAGNLVGAVARLRLLEPLEHWARLQEVDVFPSYRGQRYGNALLAAVLDLLADEGTTRVVVGADEDGWPLTWYRRRGFHDVARVSLTR
ncbi:MAG: GNAT family N-acetyltransferase [Streptosporangiales bacterium]